MEVRIRRTGGGNRSPPRRQLSGFLNSAALEEVNELGACVPMQRKRGARGESHQLHGSTIRRTQILDLDTISEGRFTPRNAVGILEMIVGHAAQSRFTISRIVFLLMSMDCSFPAGQRRLCRTDDRPVSY